MSKEEMRTIAFWADDQVRCVKIHEDIDHPEHRTIEFEDVNDLLFYLLVGSPDPFRIPNLGIDENN